MGTISDYITIDPSIQFGKPVFKGTTVTVQSLFWHLEEGVTVSEFLENFPNVTYEQAVAVIELSDTLPKGI